MLVQVRVVNHIDVSHSGGVKLWFVKHNLQQVQTLSLHEHLIHALYLAHSQEAQLVVRDVRPQRPQTRPMLLRDLLLLQSAKYGSGGLLLSDALVDQLLDMELHAGRPILLGGMVVLVSHLHIAVAGGLTNDAQLPWAMKAIELRTLVVMDLQGQHQGPSQTETLPANRDIHPPFRPPPKLCVCGGVCLAETHRCATALVVTRFGALRQSVLAILLENIE